MIMVMFQVLKVTDIFYVSDESSQIFDAETATLKHHTHIHPHLFRRIVRQTDNSRALIASVFLEDFWVQPIGQFGT